MKKKSFNFTFRNQQKPKKDINKYYFVYKYYYIKFIYNINTIYH